MKRKLMTLLMALVGLTTSAQTIRRGDVNGDGEISIADVTALVDLVLGKHTYVDLGLPSGTLWATTNIGANFPEEYGLYFAWGEMEPKLDYSWATYRWCNGTESVMTKYCSDAAYGTPDDKFELDVEDDAAYVLWGSEWRMPSLEQFEELCSECKWSWTRVNGINGSLVESKVNGNSIFLPAGGWMNGSTLELAGEKGYCWSRTINNERCTGACYLGYNSIDHYTNNYWGRYGGWCIRPVRNQ